MLPNPQEIFSTVQVGVLREDRIEFLRTIVSLHGSNENIAWL